MSLKLPLNFKNDIAGRDTNLVPLIVIGNFDPDVDTVISDPALWLSTNSFTYTWASGSTPILPLLLNIPSLKESIDIEKRNYKISSVNLDISNFPHEGKRFSELIGDMSLINTECRIYWTSPSTTHLPIAGDIIDDSYFPVYYGTIRRYTHDDEKVRLVVEDRSQATLHKDLPGEILGTDDSVPDKYKNKPIPMVYGHVDKSPCLYYKGYFFAGDKNITLWYR